MHMPGAMGILLIVIVALLLFGPNKLPELGRAFGKTLREFKNGAKDLMGDEEHPQPGQPQRKEIPADEVRVHEVRSTPASANDVPAAGDVTPGDGKPQPRQDNRRLPD